MIEKHQRLAFRLHRQVCRKGHGLAAGLVQRCYGLHRCGGAAAVVHGHLPPATIPA